MSAQIACSILQNKETEFAAREAALLKKEAELAAREAALLKKEAEKEIKGKLFMINYISDYERLSAESEVFISSDEKTTALAAFDWMVENRKGLDFELTLQCGLEEDDDNTYEDEEALAAHVRKSCNSFKDLKKICEKYNNSYFEEGWKLKFSQI